MRQAVDGAPAFVYNEHNNAHRAWPGTGANSPQRAQCPLRGADTEDTNVTKKKIGVLGAGTWGMALARMLCVSGNDVQVWSALPAEVENLSATRVHPNLPGMKIPEELQFTKSIEEVCTGKDVLLFAVPSVFVRSTTAKARPYIPDGQILVDVAKGMEPDTLYTMTEVIADELNREGGPKGVKLVALSGPTHAEEVALDMPTTIVSACPDEAAAEYVQDVFSNTCMRVYTNADIKGVELSGPRFCSSSSTNRCSSCTIRAPLGSRMGRPWPTRSQVVNSSSSRPNLLWSLFLASSIFCRCSSSRDCFGKETP